MDYEKELQQTVMRRKAGLILAEARLASGLSQEALALKIGKTRRTVQAWENGTSLPDMVQMFDWFAACEVNPRPYLARFKNDNVDISEDAQLDQYLISALDSMTVHEKRILKFLCYGHHGHSVYAYLQKMIADLQTPMGSCYNTALMIESNYRNAKARGEIMYPDEVQPDLETLNEAIQKGREAFINGKNEYN